MDSRFPILIRYTNDLIHRELGRSIRDSEVAAMQCAWHQIRYAEFESNSATYAKQYQQCYNDHTKKKVRQTLMSAASRIYKLLRQEFNFDRRLTRSNFKATILENWDLSDPKSKADSLSKLKNRSASSPFSPQNIANQLETDTDSENDFVILTDDIQEVSSFFNSDRRLIEIYGPPGIGKTTLVNYVSSVFGESFEQCIYTDLRYIGSFVQWAFEVLADAHLFQDAAEDRLMSLLRELLDSKNVVLIIDSISILDKEMRAFLEAFALKTMASNSKVVLSCKKKLPLNVPEKIRAVYQMGGLQSQSEIQQFFSFLELEDPEFWPAMNNFYCGNFRDISYAARFIKDFFGGSVAEYWQSGSRLLSPETTEEFESVNFSDLDHWIFDMFSGDEKHSISRSILKTLKSDTKSSEIWTRVNYLCDLGYLNQERDPQSNLLTYSIIPTLKSYLEQRSHVES